MKIKDVDRWTGI